ncbi:hypothetical protein Tco_0844357, partial [Tanacetum coccineum]
MYDLYSGAFMGKLITIDSYFKRKSSDSTENATQRNRPPPTPHPGFEEILDPKPKKEKESKHPVIIEIDDDDDDDPGDRDLMKASSSKRRRVSDEIESDDNDDECILVLKRKKVYEEVTKDRKNANHDDKIPTRTQPASHSKSPF